MAELFSHLKNLPRRLRFSTPAIQHSFKFLDVQNRILHTRAVIALCGIDAIAAIKRAHLTILAEQQVITVLAEELIVTGVSFEGVGSRTAPDRVIAGIADEFVVEGVADD